MDEIIEVRLFHTHNTRMFSSLSPLLSYLIFTFTQNSKDILMFTNLKKCCDICYSYVNVIVTSMFAIM